MVLLFAQLIDWLALCLNEKRAYQIVSDKHSSNQSLGTVNTVRILAPALKFLN